MPLRMFLPPDVDECIFQIVILSNYNHYNTLVFYQMLYLLSFAQTVFGFDVAKIIFEIQINKHNRNLGHQDQGAKALAIFCFC